MKIKIEVPHIKLKRHIEGHEGMHPPKKPGDIGYDLLSSEDFELPPHGSSAHAFIIPAGCSMKIPDGYFCMIMGRSSTARRGIGIQTAVIDSEYVGPLFGCAWNMTDRVIKIAKGERIAQAVFFPSCVFPIKEVEELPVTERGATGFGSTGC